MASSLHRFHPNPDIGDPVDAIVWDNCPGCHENALDPFAHLDSTNLARIQARLVGVVNSEEEFLTACEVLACRKFYEDIERTFGPEHVLAWPTDAVHEYFDARQWAHPKV